MKKIIKENIVSLLKKFNLEVREINKGSQVIPLEFNQNDIDVFDYVVEHELTMVSKARLISTMIACKHAVLAEINGAFVETGVWRGGVALAAKMIFENYKSKKEVYLFDTFQGMTRSPTEIDVKNRARQMWKKNPVKRFNENLKKNQSDWAFASIEDVRSNFINAKVDLKGVNFIKGDVVETLKLNENIPNNICVLRLDTNFYESTKMEIETLYPRLELGGSLLLDDYGSWEGSKKATDDYLNSLSNKKRPLMSFVDAAGRSLIKVRS
jgi:O-methyltransferase